MIKSILTHIGGIENYGIISMSLFVFVFVSMLIWSFCLKKSHLNKMAAAPLEPDTDNLNSTKTHE
jgi:uncharacterized membrane protein YhaH (DUF805 family)